MKIEDLKTISYKILKGAQISSLPVDSHKLLSYYDVKPEKLTDVENDLKYLIADRKTTLLGAKENSTLIYNDTIAYSNYMLIRRFCEKILKSSDIRDIEILTLLIMSPPVIVGYLGVYDVRQISALCQIPPHKIHQYYDVYAQLYADLDIQLLELFMPFLRKYKRENKMRFQRIKSIIQGLKEKKLDEEKDVLVYIRDSETVYHGPTCPEIIDEIDVEVLDLYTAKQLNYNPCPTCFDLE